MYITLVRSADTFSDEDGRILGYKNAKISRKGITNALFLKDKIRDEKYDICYMSGLARSVETAMILVGDRVLTQVDKRLNERDFGEFSGKSTKKYDKTKFWDYNLNSKDNGVECIQDLFKRCEDFLNDIKKDNKDVLIVSHESIIRCMHYLLNNKSYDNLLDIDIPNCYMEKIEVIE